MSWILQKNNAGVCRLENARQLVSHKPIQNKNVKGWCRIRNQMSFC